MSIRTRRKSSPITAWPGYVDVLSALLMVVIFVLMVFIIAQFLLSQILYRQKNELAALHDQVAQLTELLGLEKTKTLQLNAQITQLSDSISNLTEEKDSLIAQLEDYSTQAEMDLEKIRVQMLSMASLNEDIHALRIVKDRLEKDVGQLASALSDRKNEILELRDRTKSLTTQLSDKTELTHLAQKKIGSQNIRIQALTSVLDEQKRILEKEKQLSADARAEIARLTTQINGLRSQLGMISKALALTEQAVSTKDEKIVELGKKLNTALARRVSQLEKYKSEFFGRLRHVVENNPAIQIKGDRFVLQAGLLFASGSAELGDGGQSHLISIADTLKEIAVKIPDELDWILRIDGHTDRIPINNAIFASNWELSVARAVSVVRFLSRSGIPENRMAATGFGKHHPIDPRNTQEAYQKNRRIEIKLTSK